MRSSGAGGGCTRLRIDKRIDIRAAVLYYGEMAKTTQLQIRVSDDEKELIRASAARANLDMSTWILQTLLSASELQFRGILRSMATQPRPELYAELIDLLDRLSAAELLSIRNPESELDELSAYQQNYVCALVEQRAHKLGVRAPKWSGDVSPLTTPVFGTPLKSLRAYLLTQAPVAFRRRNIFVDAGLGARV